MHQFLRLDLMQHSSSFEKKNIYSKNISCSFHDNMQWFVVTQKEKKNDFYLS